MTILFADVRNSTTITRELGVERMRSLLDRFFRTAYDIVVDADGIVDKFLGDAVLALFNVPVRREDHVARSVSVAMRLQRAVQSLNAEATEEEALGVGIALSTGFAIAGRLGSNDPSSYTAVGEIVNLAARLQQKAEPGQVLVTQTVYDVIGPAFPNARPGNFELAGFEKPVVAYLLS